MTPRDATVWELEKSTWPNHELSRFVRAAGLTWHVQHSGNGPALLLIHGTGASVHSWRKLLPLLARGYSVWAVDLPGHGFTDTVAGARSSIAGMAACIAELLRVLDVRPAFCVGHSAGAVILCRMAMDRQIAPRVIISINGAFMPLAGAPGILFSPIARLMARVPLLPHLLSSRAGNPGSVARVIAGTGSRLDAEGLELYARLVSKPKHVAGALEMMGHWNLREFVQDLPTLVTPLILLVAENDRTVPPQQALAVKRHVAGAKIHRLPGLGHLAHEEEPGLVADELLRICAAH